MRNWKQIEEIKPIDSDKVRIKLAGRVKKVTATAKENFQVGEIVLLKYEKLWRVQK